MPGDKPPIVDLDQLGADRVKMSLETVDPGERDSKLRIAEADARVARLKDLGQVLFAGLCLLGLGAYCMLILRAQGTSADDKKWAQTVLAAMVSGFIGYLFGKKSGG
ncbi:MAG: hypothetical protein JST92_09140 [Deltaproteobacteria bacterium]|nr:hypothetical protein [Deltaproteobacteria bacterium]